MLLGISNAVSMLKSAGAFFNIHIQLNECDAISLQAKLQFPNEFERIDRLMGILRVIYPLASLFKSSLAKFNEQTRGFRYLEASN